MQVGRLDPQTAASGVFFLFSTAEKFCSLSGQVYLRQGSLKIILYARACKMQQRFKRATSPKRYCTKKRTITEAHSCIANPPQLLPEQNHRTLRVSWPCHFLLIPFRPLAQVHRGLFDLSKFRNNRENDRWQLLFLFKYFLCIVVLRLLQKTPTETTVLWDGFQSSPPEANLGTTWAEMGHRHVLVNSEAC